MTQTVALAEVRGRVDFAIITIREDEFAAVLKRFEPRQPVTGGKQHYEYCRFETGGAVIVRSLEQGLTPAQAVARDVIEDLDPLWLILTGIAGGVPHVDFSLGDVLLSSRLHDFSVSAAIHGSRSEYQQSGGPMHPDVERLLAALPAWHDRLGDWNSEVSIGRQKPRIDVPRGLNNRSLYGSLDLKRKVRDSLARHFLATVPVRQPLFRIGPGATANVLVKDPSLLQHWQESARHLTHVEMEAGGVYEAARRGGHGNYPLLCVRGISDIIGFRRSPDWTEYACHTAASFVHALVHSGRALFNTTTISEDEQARKRRASKTEKQHETTDIPQIVRDAIDEGVDLFNEGFPEKAKAKFEQALLSAEQASHPIAIVDAKEHIASVLVAFDGDLERARELLDSCLVTLGSESGTAKHGRVLTQLAHLHEKTGNLELSETLLRQAITLCDHTEKAGMLIRLAWTVGRRGGTDEALRLNQEAYTLLIQALHEVGPEDKRGTTFILTVLGNLFFQRAKIHQRRAEPDEAEVALKTALDWQRKAGANHEMAKLLVEFASLKFFKRQLEEGVAYLQEAANIYEERGMVNRFVECLEMMGRVHASVQNYDRAEAFFMSAAAAAEDKSLPREAAEAWISLAHLARDQRDDESARQRFEGAMELCEDGEIQVSCLEALGDIAKSKDNEKERRRLNEAVVDRLKEDLAREKPDPERANGYLKLAYNLRELERLDEALSYARKAHDLFEMTGNSFGRAKAAFEIAGLLDHLGRKDEARAACVSLLRAIEGKPFFEIIAAAELSLARFALEEKKFPEARRLIDHGLKLCRDHDLNLLSEALLLEDHLETVRKFGTDAGSSIQELLRGLHEQLELCPANKQGYVRFWCFSHARKIGSALRGLPGPNLAVLTDDLADFLDVSAKLKLYRDWSLFVALSEYPDNIDEIIPLTGKMLIPPDGVALLGLKANDQGTGDNLDVSDKQVYLKRVRANSEVRARLAVAGVSTGGSIARYFMVSINKDSDLYGGASGGLMGKSLALPAAVHELIEGREVEELSRERLFFFYYNRGLLEEHKKLWYDLVGLRDFRCFPVYRGCLPKSDEVRVVSSCDVILPILVAGDPGDRKPLVRRVQNALRDLLFTTEVTAVSKVAHLAEVAEDLAEQSDRESKLHLSFYALSFDRSEETLVHGAIVLR